MNYPSILDKRLFFLPLIFVSYILMAQPANTVAEENTNLNITPFGTIRYWINSNDPLMKPLGEPTNFDEYNDGRSVPQNIGILWWEPRDIQSVEVVFNSKVPVDFINATSVQYWYETWPQPPPKMPTIEDIEDDPWRGIWITAEANVLIKGNRILYTFQPLSEKENVNASYLPGSTVYRRTLKIRLIFPHKPPQKIAEINAFSMAKEKGESIRIELGCGKSVSSSFEGKLEVFNGSLNNISGWNWNRGDRKTGKSSWEINLTGKQKGITANIQSAVETLPGSNAETVVTLRSNQGTFSFAPKDLESGPIYIPDFNAYITRSNDPTSFAKANPVQGHTIREEIWKQPEQSYTRARKEIPHLDPTHDQSGNRIYLPLASDASWQKFAVRWGGDIFINKAKAGGKESARCIWTGDEIDWNFGTGSEPVYHRTKENCQMSILHNYLPVVNARWRDDSLIYDEEVFTTLLQGPLSPDSNRNEQTPAILMVKLTVSNPSLRPKNANIWLSGNKGLNNLVTDKHFIMDQINGEKYIRCYIKSTLKDQDSFDLQQDSTGSNRIIYQKAHLDANSSKELYFYFPFVGDLRENEKSKIASLDYNTEKNRVVSYWRNLVSKYIIYDVPEQKFNEIAKVVIPHIRMSTTKDPESGLFMVPAASLGYGVYANEAVFQTVLLDRMGDFTTASDYLNTFVELQGSRELPGAFTGDQKDVFYGVKVDSAHDLTANGYNMAHGTVLWGLAHHYLHSGEKEWLLKVAPNMRRAVNWIIEQRNHTKKLDVNGDTAMQYGLLPPGTLEDPSDWRFWYATNAYTYLGLETMAKAFEQAGLPKADYYKREVASYYEDIRRSIKRARELSPVVQLRNGTYIPYIPTRPYQRFRYFGAKKVEYYDRYKKGIHPMLRLSATREALYGPIILLKTGIIDANEPTSNWILNDWEDNLTLSTSLNLNPHGWVDDVYWFSRGGMAFQANLQNPVVPYLQRHEIPAAIRTLYNDFVAVLYPDINQFTEEYRMWQHASGPFYKIPDECRFISQVCDLLVMKNEDELWLANGVPKLWLEPGQKIELKKAYTEYGSLTYTLQAGNTSETIEANIKLPEMACSKILLFVRAPFQKPIRRVTINGQEWKQWDSDKESVVIPQTTKNVHVSVFY